MIKYVLLLGIILNCSVSSIASHEEAEKEYQVAIYKLERLAISFHNTLEIRNILVELFYASDVIHAQAKFSRTGIYEDEIRIEQGLKVIQVPEWCLLRYLGMIENTHLAQKKSLSSKQNMQYNNYRF